MGKRPRKVSECSCLARWFFDSTPQCRTLPFRLALMEDCFIFLEREPKSNNPFPFISCKSWILTLVAKKDRHRGKGVRETENSRIFDSLGLFSQMWGEMRETRPEACVVKGLSRSWESSEGAGRSFELPRETITG